MSTRSGPRFETLVAEAASWRALGMLFERPREAWRGELRALASELTVPALAAAAQCAVDEGSEAHYLAVLGPGGPVSPREIAYRRMGDPGHLLARLGLLYPAFGYAPDTEEPPDHVSVEAGFVGFLRMKEAFALASDDLEGSAMVRRAADVFVSEHLAYLAVGLDERLALVAESYLRPGAAQLLALVGPVPAHVAAARAAPTADAFDSCASGCRFDGASST